MIAAHQREVTKMKSNVVQMGTVRELLAQIDRLRAEVLAGDVSGWGGSVLFADGRETVYIGGNFRENAEAQARSMLKVSALRVMREDTPPKLAQAR